jgi:hypothetical protein
VTCETVAGKATKMAAFTMPSTKAASMTTATSTMATAASSSTCKCAGGCDRQNAGQNQTSQRTLD